MWDKKVFGQNEMDKKQIWWKIALTFFFYFFEFQLFLNEFDFLFRSFIIQYDLKI
jgi:hypothetical protein